MASLLFAGVCLAGVTSVVVGYDAAQAKQDSGQGDMLCSTDPDAATAKPSTEIFDCPALRGPR